MYITFQRLVLRYTVATRKHLHSFTTSLMVVVLCEPCVQRTSSSGQSSMPSHHDASGMHIPLVGQRSSASEHGSHLHEHAVAPGIERRPVGHGGH